MPVPSSISKQQYVFFSNSFFIYSIYKIFHAQADVNKVIEFREGPEELTKAEIDAKLLN